MVAFTPYSPQSKRQRKLLHKAFAASVIPTYYPLLLSSTKPLLAALARRGASGKGGLYDMLKRYAGSITLSVVYGYEVGLSDAYMGRGRPLDKNADKKDEDAFLDLATECVDLLSQKIASGGGIWLVDIFPSLKCVLHVARLPARANLWL